MLSMLSLSDAYRSRWTDYNECTICGNMRCDAHTYEKKKSGRERTWRTLVINVRSLRESLLDELEVRLLRSPVELPSRRVGVRLRRLLFFRAHRRDQKERRESEGDGAVGHCEKRAGGGLAALTQVDLFGNPTSEEPVQAALRQRLEARQSQQ